MESEAEATSIFERDGDRFVPTAMSTGPWRADAQHGGSVGALVGMLVEAGLEEGEQVASIQIDLERTIPIEPLTAHVERIRLSRRVAHLEVELRAPGGPVVGARALLLRAEPIPTVPAVDEPLIGPEGLEPMVWPEGARQTWTAFHRDAMEYRFIEGGFLEPGPSVAWLRLRTELIAGEPLGAFAALLAAADFGSALCQTVAPGAGAGLINLDIDVTLLRAPVGPWFRLDAHGRVGAGGVGLAVTRLSDLDGPLGVVTQSQLGFVISARS